ncbi:neural proliferation differentiation and control protein 1a [Paramormyrops kingsleyae]|uniref:Neural proliferation, differentiation and control, 1a n=1 Tax=Paramormyrops kingsleyae TaxID=1676925 RepID=A0A3B3SXS9_9TELE|nr:neural proliferation differentiation and control protein 1-like [Paramormyrops kingsleyae]
MLLLPRSSERRAGASLLHGLLCAVLAVSSASARVKRCPEPLDCAIQKRQFCPPGASHCGPCLTPLVENSKGICINWKNHVRSDIHPAAEPELDDEIDALSSILAKEQQLNILETKVKSSKSPLHETTPAQNSTMTPSAPHAPTPRALTRAGGPMVAPHPSRDTLLIIMISVCIIFGTVALILAAVCLVRLQRGLRLAQKVDYPAYGMMGPNHSDGTLPGDKNLAQSAQMYHYQHQKQQMLSMDKHKDETKIPDSGTTSDEENEDGDFTVYECPGLAPTGEMEVKNPLFDDYGVNPQRRHK